MRYKRGIALPAALGIAALVIILGLAGTMMAQNNLSTAANLQHNTRARYAAEAGVDYAIASMKAGYFPKPEIKIGDYVVEVPPPQLFEDEADAALDEDESEAIEDDVDDWDAVDLTDPVDAEDQPTYYLVSSTATSAAARYEVIAELRLEGDPPVPSETIPLSEWDNLPSLVGEKIHLHSKKKDTSTIENGVHGNLGYNLKGNLGFSSSKPTASCSGNGPKKSKRKCTCKDGVTTAHSPFCAAKDKPTSDNLVPHIPVPSVNYKALRDKNKPALFAYTINPAAAARNVDGGLNKLIPGFTTPVVPTAIRISGGGTIRFMKDIDLTNVILVLDTGTEVEFRGKTILSSSMIFAEKVRFNSDLIMEDSKVFGDKEVIVQKGNVSYSGTNTLAAGKNLKLYDSDVAADDSAPSGSKLNFIAQRDLKIRGNVDADAAFLAGRKFDFKGKKGKAFDIRGFVFAGKRVNLKGTFNVHKPTSDLLSDNPDLDPGTGTGSRVISVLNRK